MAKTDRFVPPIARSPRLSDRVADKLLETILERGLRPGDKLPSERELGEQFGVSRTVVREATRALVAKGIIDVRSGTGLTVSAVDPSNVKSSMGLFIRGSAIPYEHVHQVRSVLEVEIAGLAADRRDDAAIERLTAIHKRLISKHKNGDGQGFAVADVEFHRELAATTGNTLFAVLLDAIATPLLGIRRTLSANEDPVIARRNQTRAAKAHKAILDVVVAGQIDEAREAMRAHLAAVYKGWTDLDRAT